MPAADLRDALERFRARPVEWFLRVFGIAIVAEVAFEITGGVLRVHTGELYPWRHLGVLPLYPAWALILEWALRGGAGLALALGARRVRIVAWALRVATPALLVAVLERYSNHGALMVIVAFFVLLDPPDVASPSFEDHARPALGLVRAQLVIVYVMSAINKLTHGFASGASLTNLAENAGHHLDIGAARAASVFVMGAELSLPFLLVVAPRLGVLGVVLLHVAFSAFVPNVASFGLTMLAMSLTFLRGAPEPSLQGRSSTLPRAFRS